jgi:hypothetical protein
VRKHFNGAAVNEIDVVVELVYKSRNKGKRHWLLASHTTLHTTDTAQTRHSACARHLGSPRRHDESAKHDDPQILQLLHALCTFWTRHRRQFPCCIPSSIAFGHIDDDIGDWTGVGFRLCCLHVSAGIQGTALRYAYALHRINLDTL